MRYRVRTACFRPPPLAVLVCRRTANLGMALTKARLAMPEIEAAV